MKNNYKIRADPFNPYNPCAKKITDLNLIQYKRAFGEMVALLWARGQNGATVQLGHLWNHFKQKNELSLFCAYPKSGLTQDINSSINQICGCHTKMITNSKSVGEILYNIA